MFQPHHVTWDEGRNLPLDGRQGAACSVAGLRSGLGMTPPSSSPPLPPPLPPPTPGLRAGLRERLWLLGLGDGLGLTSLGEGLALAGLIGLGEALGPRLSLAL